VRALDALRDKVDLDRDPQGRYVIKDGNTRSKLTGFDAGGSGMIRSVKTGACLPEARRADCREFGLWSPGCWAGGAAHAQDTTRASRHGARARLGRQHDRDREGYFREAGIRVEIEDIRYLGQFLWRCWRRTGVQIVEGGGRPAGYFNALDKNLPIVIVGRSRHLAAPPPASHSAAA